MDRMADFITTGERDALRPFLVSFAKSASGGKSKDDDEDDDDSDDDDDEDEDDEDDDLADMSEDDLREALKKTRGSLAKASGSSKSKRERIRKLQRELDEARSGKSGKAKKSKDDDDDDSVDLDEIRDAARREGEKKGLDRVKRAEAKTALIAAGVSRERVGRFVGMLNLDDIDVDDDGEIDEDALDEAIEALKEDVPEAFARTRKRRGSVSGGSDRNGEGDDERRKKPLTASEQMAARILKKERSR